MAIYHLEAKIVTRGEGRTACGAAAYMSCSKILNDYDGIQHDYTHKGGLVWEHIFLPPMAPAEWQDRENLWNAVEAAEKTKDSRLAREFIAALPRELGVEEWKTLLTEFIQNQFVADGMCADVAIHDTDGHNPHAHILLTVRPLDEKGAWQHKTEKEYLCVRNGEERGFTAKEFKTAQAEGWEKQYPYKVGKKKEYMTTAEGEARGLERASKYPKSTKYGRQNPTPERWNSEEQLVAWRAAWADVVNSALERAGRSERIDHRSHADRGLDEQPTVHEGYVAREIEQQGFISEVCEMNRQIRTDNALIRELKETIHKLTEAAVMTLEELAHALEAIRRDLIVLFYKLWHIRDRRSKVSAYLTDAEAAYQSYGDLTGRAAKKRKQIARLKKELKAVSALNIFKRKELNSKITELIEDVGELDFERSEIIRNMGKASHDEMSAFPEHLKTVRDNIGKMDELDARYTYGIEKARQELAGLMEDAAGFDPCELRDACLAIRPQMQEEAEERIRKASTGERISVQGLLAGIRDADMALDEAERSMKQKVRQTTRTQDRMKRAEHDAR